MAQWCPVYHVSTLLYCGLGQNAGKVFISVIKREESVPELKPKLCRFGKRRKLAAVTITNERFIIVQLSK